MDDGWVFFFFFRVPIVIQKKLNSIKPTLRGTKDVYEKIKRYEQIYVIKPQPILE